MGTPECVQSIRMKLLLPLLFAFIVVASGTILDNDMKHVDSYLFREFSNFKTKFDKTYSSQAEELTRLSIFEKNIYNMNQHNTKSGSTYKQGINAFSDLTDEEFKSLYLGGYTPMPTPSSGTASASTLPYGNRNMKQLLPASVDWRKSGAMTDIKTQGVCGSCWAMVTTEMIESYVQIKTGTLPVLSRQQVTSCTPNPLQCGGSGGCSGSIPQLGFNYVQLFGILSEEDYPYMSGITKETGECQYNLTVMTPVASITGYNTLPANDQDAVLTHLANEGPLSIAVDASAWGRYSHGVFDNCSYDQNITITHAVQLVGYDTDEAEGDYWLARNSWGSDWGEDGYIRLKRDQKARCGINSSPLKGTACVGGPGSDQQTVCGMCGMLLDSSYPMGAQLVKNWSWS